MPTLQAFLAPFAVGQLALFGIQVRDVDSELSLYHNGSVVSKRHADTYEAWTLDMLDLDCQR